MHLYKTFIEKICCEIGIAQNPKATLLVCPGLPGIPKEQQLLKKLTEHNYNTIYPRYRGTFESEGLFLRDSPVTELVFLINTLKKKNTFKEVYNQTMKQIGLNNIIVLGSSFGADVALGVASRLQVPCFILCPVTDYSSVGSEEGEQRVEHLEQFMREGFPFLYRIADDGFEKLRSNKLLLPASDLLENHNKKIILVHGAKDTTVALKRSKSLATFPFVDFFIFDTKGHLTFSSLPERFLLKCLDQLVGHTTSF